MDAYRPRVIEALLKRKLRSAGAILVEGVKWCGKSTTAAQFANSHVYLANPATYRQNMTFAEVNPSALLEGETPRLIDEWQLAPELWDAVRGEVYHYRDSSGLECDAVVHLRNGHYCLVEIKLGGETAIGSAVKTLNKLESNIDTDKMKAPSFKMVLIGVGQYAYRRKDGIYVVPVSCLKN